MFGTPDTTRDDTHTHTQTHTHPQPETKRKRTNRNYEMYIPKLLQNTRKTAPNNIKTFPTIDQ